MIDTEKAALERRIDELCAKVEAEKQRNDKLFEAAEKWMAKAAHFEAENTKLREQNDKLTNVIGCLMYVKPRDVTSILVNGKVHRIDELLADAGLRWEDL